MRTLCYTGWKILFKKQSPKLCKVFLFNKLTYKSRSYALPTFIRPSSLFQLNWLLPVYLSKHSLLQRNVSKVNQPVPSGEEIKGMKMDILKSFQSRLNFVGWRCFFSLGAFFRSSRCSSLSTVKIQKKGLESLLRYYAFYPGAYWLNGSAYSIFQKLRNKIILACRFINQASCFFVNFFKVQPKTFK